MGVLLADVTGDDRLDLIVTNQSDSGNFNSVFRNTTPAATGTPCDLFLSASDDKLPIVVPSDIQIPDSPAQESIDISRSPELSSLIGAMGSPADPAEDDSDLFFELL